MPHPLVLVVEDDPFVRAVAVDFLEEDGFEVIEASTADYAASVVHSRDDIGLVFTDISMPGTMNGLDLARLVLVMYPRTAVLITSGALPPGVASVMSGAQFIPKPYQMNAVIRVIREMMGDR